MTCLGAVGVVAVLSGGARVAAAACVVSAGTFVSTFDPSYPPSPC